MGLGRRRRVWLTKSIQYITPPAYSRLYNTYKHKPLRPQFPIFERANTCRHYKDEESFDFNCFIFLFPFAVSCHKGAKGDQQQHGHFLLHDNQFRNRDLTIFDSPALDGECFLQVWYTKTIIDFFFGRSPSSFLLGSPLRPKKKKSSPLLFLFVLLLLSTGIKRADQLVLYIYIPPPPSSPSSSPSVPEFRGGCIPFGALRDTMSLELLVQ